MLEMTGWSSSLAVTVAAGGAVALAMGLLAWAVCARRPEGLDDIHRPRLTRDCRKRVRARLGKVVL